MIPDEFLPVAIPTSESKETSRRKERTSDACVIAVAAAASRETLHAEVEKRTQEDSDRRKGRSKPGAVTDD